MVRLSWCIFSITVKDVEHQLLKLTDEQQAFLAQHQIPSDKVFDATGMMVGEYKLAMREGGYWVAIGVTPCKESGHMLRSRAGHCIQCDPARITYLKKHSIPGRVYVAWSAAKGLVKIGVTNNTQKRVVLLNSDGYGGAYDWKLVRAWECDEAGKVETKAHQNLESHAAGGLYLKNDKAIESKELFACAAEHAVHVIEQIINPTVHSKGSVVEVTWPSTVRSRKLPTTVALHLVHEALKIIDDNASTLTPEVSQAIRGLADSILSAISHGMRNQIVSVPQACIDAYMELSEIVDSFKNDLALPSDKQGAG